jgi:hypothetical protein
MDIERALTVINQMLADGVVENYALGGAVAAIFYTSPTVSAATASCTRWTPD